MAAHDRPTGFIDDDGGLLNDERGLMARERRIPST
jgi:hypothetical protein